MAFAGAEPQTLVELTDEELAVATMLDARPDHAVLDQAASIAARKRLEDARLMEKGRPVGVLAEVADLVRAAPLRLQLDVWQQEEVTAHRARRDETRAILGTATAAGALAMRRVEPAALAGILVGLAGLPPDAGRDGRGPARAGERAREGHRPRGWRLRSADVAGHEVSLTVLHAERRGLWVVHAEAETVPRALAFEPVAAPALARAVAALCGPGA